MQSENESTTIKIENENRENDYEIYTIMSRTLRGKRNREYISK